MMRKLTLILFVLFSIVPFKALSQELPPEPGANVNKIVGADSTGLNNNYLWVDTDGSLSCRQMDGLGQFIDSTLVSSKRALDVDVLHSVLPDGGSTAANQALEIDQLIIVNGHLVVLEEYLDEVESKLDTVNTNLTSFQAANHTDLLGVQSRIDTTNSKLDTVNGNLVTIQNKQDDAQATLDSIDADTTSLDIKFNVNLSTRASEATLLSFQSANHADHVALKTSVDSFASQNNSNLVTIQGKQDLQTTQLNAINANTDTLETLTGSLTETAPVTDTASSGLNGRLQRVAQNITSTNTKLDTVNTNLVTIQGKQDLQTTQLNAINANTDDVETRLGATNETAAATDTSTSGHNGLLKRIAQRLSTLIAFYANDYGSSANAIRVASQPGNATGAADFNAGTTGAQTPRVTANITRNGTELDYNYGTVSGNTPRVASQIGNATGAADYNYGTVGAQTVRSAAQIGNATGAASFGAGAVGAQTLRVAANLHDGGGTAVTSRTYDATRPVDVYVTQIGASNATHTRTTFVTGNVSTQIAAANAARKWLIISNASGASFFIKFGATAVVSQGIEIPNNTTYEMSAHMLYLGAINAIVGSNNRTIEVIEGF